MWKNLVTNSNKSPSTNLILIREIKVDLCNLTKETQYKIIDKDNKHRNQTIWSNIR